MTESFKFPTGVRPLTLGNSFKNNEEFCTIRYDFRPGTEAVEETSSLTITDSDQVTLTTHSGTNENNGSQTQYKGSVKPYEKECILVVNNLTGEIRLEKLSRNIQLKKTRIVQKEKHSKHREQKDSSSPKRSPDIKNVTNIGLTSPRPNYRDGDAALSVSNSAFSADDSSDSSDEESCSNAKFDSLFPEMKESKQLKSNELDTAMHNSMGAPISDLSGSSSSGDSSDSEDDSSSSSSAPAPDKNKQTLSLPPLQKTDRPNGSISPFSIDDDLKLSESESDD